MARQSTSETVKGLLGLVFLVGGGYWLYTTFLASEPPPPRINLTDAGVFGDANLPKIVETSKDNELKFKADYSGKPFLAEGTFKEANSDFNKYHLTIDTPNGPVACETRNEAVTHKLATLELGQGVTITGIIDDTWMGDLVLRQCDVR